MTPSQVRWSYTFLLGMVLALCAAGQAAVAATPLTPKYRQQVENDLAHWKTLLDEYHQGKRDDNDGVAILWNILHDKGVLAYGLAGSTNTAETAQLLSEWKTLLAKHPEFRDNQPLEVHEQVEARKARQAEAQTLLEKANSLVPKDSQVFNVLGYEDHMALVYQYHVDFFKLPTPMKLERNGDYRTTSFHINDAGRIIDGRPKISEETTNRGLKPFQTMTFRHHIQATYEVSGAKDFRHFIWICDQLPSYYLGGDEDEHQILRRKYGPDEAMPWLNEAGKYKEFCGAVSMEGKIIYQLPIKQHLPDTLVWIGRTNGDGSSIALQVGELVTAAIESGSVIVDAAPGKTVQNPKYRQLLIYTFPDKLETIDIKGKDRRQIRKLLKDHDF